MLSGPVIITVAFLYLGLLFAIAYYGDRRADQGRSLIANPSIYALSIAVYCTSWTFYGSVGRAASSGVDFLPIYLGPTLTFVVGWFVIRKIIRISKVNRTTSIADFVASRYGKSFQLGGLVTVIAVVGILPYISLQLKAISTSFSLLLHYPEVVLPTSSASAFFLQDTAFYVALFMAVFAILFGARHIDASEQHEGMVAAIAFESVVKLVAFLAVGLFVTFGLYGGLGDIFARAEASDALSRLFTINGVAQHTSWITLTLLAMGAIIVLPRQFQVMVVENVDERHLKKAMWLFPLYLLLINIFVLPIAFAGLLMFPQGGVDADTFVLTIPMKEQQPLIALIAFIGGLSAATGMIIVETVALATMVCNDLVMPLLLRVGRLHRSERRDLTGILLAIRRVTIIFVVLLGYAYVRLIGESYALVTIGLVSFAAAMQFVPAIIGGIYWKGATRAGAIAGLTGGFLVWIYTLLLPSFARSGWIAQSFIEHGPFGLAALKPYALFGLAGLDPIAHATIWTMLVNVGLFVGVSLITSQSIIERSQAVQFVDIFKRSTDHGRVWRGRATIGDLRQLLVRFIGEARANAAFARLERERGRRLYDRVRPTPRSSPIRNGSSPARSARRPPGSWSHRCCARRCTTSTRSCKSWTRPRSSSSIRASLNRNRVSSRRRRRSCAPPMCACKELDRMKDDFVATVSHEVRTPLTSIRSFSEILRDNPDLDPEQRQEFISIIVQESERLSRLINDILDLAKMEAGTSDWHMADLAPKAVIEHALAATAGLFPKTRHIAPRDQDRRGPSGDPRRCGPAHAGDRQPDVQRGEVLRRARRPDPAGSLAGGRIPAPRRDRQRHRHRRHDRAKIFERFQQAGNTLTDKPQGTGLGLPISREILRRFGGDIWVESEPGKGATFSFRVPLPPIGCGKRGAASGRAPNSGLR